MVPRNNIQTVPALGTASCPPHPRLAFFLAVLGIDLEPLVVVVFTLNRIFYQASSLHPVSVLIPYPREILILWSHTETEKYQKHKIKKK